MFLYVIRIELEGEPSRKIYTDLHEKLKKYQVFQTIGADDGKRYWLPPAMYTYEATEKYTTDQVYQWLAVHVRTTGHRFRIMVNLVESWCATRGSWDR